MGHFLDKFSQEDDYDAEPVYPQILVYNVGRAGVRQIADAPNHDEATLIQGFITALRHIDNKGYVVQGAMYSPDMANIFIETDDEDWADHVDCHE
jgi:hypothetical protein